MSEYMNVTITSMLASDSDPVIVVNQEGRVTDVNRPFESAFSWSAEELIGNPVSNIIPAALHDAHHMAFSRFLVTGRGSILEQELELEIVLGDGTRIPARHYIVAERSEQGWRFAAIITRN